MKKVFTILIVFGLSFISCNSDDNSDVQKPEQPAVDAKLQAPFIWGLWQLPERTGGYDEASIDFLPRVSNSESESLQYFAFTGSFGGRAERGFYSGLQTRIGNNTPASGHRGVIFSMWGVVRAIPHNGSYLEVNNVNCDGDPGSVCVQLSRPYDWKNGMTYRLRYRIAGEAPDNPNNQLFRMSIKNLSNGVETILGDVVIPKNYGKLPALYGTFDETFPPVDSQVSLCSNYPPSDITYFNMSANNGAVPAKSWWQSDPTYTGPCVNLFTYTPLSKGYRLRLGIYVAP